MSSTQQQLTDIDRIQRLEDRLEILELANRYANAVDAHDAEATSDLFTLDGIHRTQQGRIKGSGRRQIYDYFEQSFAAQGRSFHSVHGHVIDFREDTHDATGTVTGHAELLLEETPRIVAVRYADTYQQLDGQWRFSERVQSYLYWVELSEYSAAMGHPKPVRIPEQDWAPSDWNPHI
jgi:uncharacterized protein (TIGR02246 family)